ncbi:MAG: ferritin-like domain-containing protein [Comamonas sp.]|nr:ferritin-like domain-containing protein [Comamonas sp.]
MLLRERALEVLQLPDPHAKAQAAQHMWANAHAYRIKPQALVQPPPDAALPGLPPRQELRHHTQVARRSPATLQGRAVLMHAIAHIEFNAINLALDAIWRYPAMPPAYYLDWLQVAGEEGKHFLMIAQWLQEQGWAYGDFPAHQGLWAMCEKTAHDITARMALVPRTMEARGLDATPQIQAKLRQIATPDALAAAHILDTILREEVGHVAIGNHWYRWLCQQQGHAPEAYYVQLYAQYQAPWPKPPLNHPARQAAGFSLSELQWLTMSQHRA